MQDNSFYLEWAAPRQNKPISTSSKSNVTLSFLFSFSNGQKQFSWLWKLHHPPPTDIIL